ncbi:hypothetical protein GCM10018781_01910 [Kitasatospora indigofera]|uniref:DUF4328 domain-containing protein n=1 Tax=Kitasatospora indigofera TaxID=67307 RepID=A0A919FBI4_9ACTN|nr:hypothetical protein GCM10018781_01910 [Kitasatospora indigofera]
MKPATTTPRACDPRPLAVFAQALILLQAAGELVLGLTSDGGSELYREVGRWTLPLFAGGVVGFLGWIRRCRLNAEILSSTTHTYGRGRALGVWFIPVLMWWAPRRVVLDIRRAGGSAGTPWLINTWWTAWLAKSVGVPLCMAIDLEGNPNNPYVTVVHVVACVLAILVIQQVTTVQVSQIRVGGTAGLLAATVPRLTR